MAKCAKVGYSEINAKIALSRLIHQDKEGHTEKRAYRCPKCRRWHLTSRP
jgi:hypothetical protein